MNMDAHNLKQGDLVRFNAEFHRQTGRHAHQKIGLVAGFAIPGHKIPLVLVIWSDKSEADMVHPSNLEVVPRMPGGVKQSSLVGKAKKHLKEFREISKTRGWKDRQIVAKLRRTENPRRVTRQRPSVARSKGKPSGFARLANKLRK